MPRSRARICTALESRGFTCWISARNIQPGENFQSSIVRAIRGAKVLLLVFTANSNRSEEMTKELALASQQKLMVVPLRVENVDPSDAFAYEFATRQWIDLFADWEVAMNNLCSRLTAALSDDRSHVDTIVLGKPSLREPAARSVAGARAQHKRAVAISALQPCCSRWHSAFALVRRQARRAGCGAARSASRSACACDPRQRRIVPPAPAELVCRGGRTRSHSGA